tara:strand:+ start:24 stop:458 length:435 start_codon:yes stop_codon:yes gene_type:complete
MAFSEYFASKILGWVKGGTFPTALTNIYVTLHTADPGTTGNTADTTNAICNLHSKPVASADLSAVTPATGGGFETTNGVVVQMVASAVNLSPITVTHFGIWNAPCTSPHGAEEFVASGSLTTSVEILQNDTVQFNIGQMAVKVI